MREIFRFLNKELHKPLPKINLVLHERSAFINVLDKRLDKIFHGIKKPRPYQLTAFYFPENIFKKTNEQDRFCKEIIYRYHERNITLSRHFEIPSRCIFLPRGTSGGILSLEAIKYFPIENQQKANDLLKKDCLLCHFEGLIHILPIEYLRFPKAKK